MSYLEALKQKRLFSQMDVIYADGSLLVAAVWLLYGVRVERRSFDMTSIAQEVFDFAAGNGRSVYIVGSQECQLRQAVKTLKERWPGLSIVGYRNGYFASEAEKDDEARRIAQLQPDILIVGMGIVSQEDFLLRAKKAGFRGLGFTCGGFIHQTARNEIDYYPAWVDRMNLRFVYRMYREPHTRMRYLKAGLIFPARFAWERLFG